MNARPARPARHRKTKTRKARSSAVSPEQRVGAHLLGLFRNGKERCALRRATGLSDEQIEKALRSPAVERRLHEAGKAWARQSWPALLRRLYDAARRGEAWAWRILMETTDLGEQLRNATSGPLETTDAFISTGFEQRLLADLRAIGKPVPARSADSPPSS